MTITLALVSQGDASADICKYVDGTGTVHYSHTLPEKGWTKILCIGIDDSTDALSEKRFESAFAQVKIGMSIEQVHRLEQVGNGCTDWPHQRAPVCGPLYYYSEVQSREDASGVVKIYSYGKDRLVVKNGIVVAIYR